MAKWCSALFLVGLLVGLPTSARCGAETTTDNDLVVPVDSGTEDALGEATAPWVVIFSHPSSNHCLSRGPIAGSSTNFPNVEPCNHTDPKQLWLYRDLGIFTVDNMCLAVRLDVVNADDGSQPVILTECVVEPSRPPHQQWTRVTNPSSGERQIISVATNTCLASGPGGGISVKECLTSKLNYYQMWSVYRVA